MVNLTQVILVVVIATLTVLSVVIGIQVVKILQELRTSMQKMNGILDDVADMTHSVSQPMVSLSGLVDNLKGGVKIVALFKKLLGRADEENEEEAEVTDEEEVEDE